MNSEDIRWEQRFANFKQALAKLAEVIKGRDMETLSELEKEGLIQRFEYTYELAWKTLQDFLRSKGYVDVKGPNPVLTQAFQDGYISDEEGWRRLKKARELTAHTYNTDTAEEIVVAIFATYFNLLKQLERKLEEEQYGSQLSLF